MARAATPGRSPFVEAALSSGLNKKGGIRAQRSTNSLLEGDPSHERLVRTKIPVRQYKHSRNADEGVDSLCLNCGTIVASTDNEWSLLDFERGHVCNK
jgi:hypothetical protein